MEMNKENQDQQVVTNDSESYGQQWCHNHNAQIQVYTKLLSDRDLHVLN